MTLYPKQEILAMPSQCVRMFPSSSIFLESIEKQKLPGTMKYNTFYYSTLNSSSLFLLLPFFRKFKSLEN